MPRPPMVLTDSTMTVVFDGKPHSIKKGDPNFTAAKAAITAQDWETVEKLVSTERAVKDWSQGQFDFKDNLVFYEGKEVPSALNKRIMEMIRKDEDPRYLMRFWKRLKANPSFRAVEQLYRFLSNSNIPIGKDGFILAYKAVKRNYWDKHTGKTFRYTIGSVVEMPRNEISDDPKVSCAPGLHVGAVNYLGGSYSGDLWVIVKVDPADVVAVPYDYNSQKMRVCRMLVVGHYGHDLPDTIFDLEDILNVDLPELTEADFEPIEPPKVEPKAAPPTPAPAAVEGPKTRVEVEAMNLGDMRKYATKIGVKRASKIPGGRDALVEVVLKHSKQDSGESQRAVESPGQESLEDRRSELLDMTLQVLRDYAKKELDVKNVKAIRGGKTALVERILLEEGKDSKVSGEPTEEPAKAPPEAPLPKAAVPQYDEIHAMSDAALQELNLGLLRKYARHKLSIVGASKIPGGKEALLQRIFDVRGSVDSGTS